MQTIVYARIRRSSSFYEAEVAPLAVLRRDDRGEYFIETVMKNDCLLEQIPLRATDYREAFGDFKRYVQTNGGQDLDAVMEELLAEQEHDRTQVRH